ncbi:MAG: hypothetical protein M3525_08920 [Acidobacteriota bacterium]|nr:hypothetical protein [Acidobacteriota bacterium]
MKDRGYRKINPTLIRDCLESKVFARQIREKARKKKTELLYFAFFGGFSRIWRATLLLSLISFGVFNQSPGDETLSVSSRLKPFESTALIRAVGF